MAQGFHCVWYSVCIFWTHYCMVRLHCLNLWIISAIFVLGVGLAVLDIGLAVLGIGLATNIRFAMLLQAYKLALVHIVNAGLWDRLIWMVWTLRCLSILGKANRQRKDRNDWCIRL